jgi:hypothetical protein
MDPIAILQQKLQDTASFGARALSEPAILDIEMLEQKLRALDGLARELFQESLRETYVSIATKLERGARLDVAEREALELLFTGEAKYYLKTENNFHDWLEELRRLMEELRAVEEGGIRSLDELLHLQALCKDAGHVLPELQFYLREQERVRRFQDSMHGELDRESGRMLAAMIRDLMASPNR